MKTFDRLDRRWEETNHQHRLPRRTKCFSTVSYKPEMLRYEVGGRPYESFLHLCPDLVIRLIMFEESSGAEKKHCSWYGKITLPTTSLC